MAMLNSDSLYRRERVTTMIFRNSIKSIFRTPVKTFLFTFLIAAVTAFLYLGANIWAASAAILRDWNANCTTIVTMEYLEDYGSNKGSKSEAMLADVAGIDFDAIAANENVLLWQPSDVGLGTTSGFVSKERSAEYSYPCMFIVTGVRQYAEDSPYYGKLVESLYSFSPYEAGRAVYIENKPGDFGFIPDPNATYVIHANNYRVSANGLSVKLSPFYSWIAQQAGVDSAAIEPFYQIESAEALHADENNVYNTIAQYYTAMNNSLTIRRARELGDLEEFNQNYLQTVSGRLFTRQEAEDGAKVCVISETLANDLDLKVGDALTIRLPDDEGATMYTWGDKMSRKETLTIVGIVNHHSDYHRNVYTPSTSDTARPVRYLYDLGQATIKNGTVDTFLTQIEMLLPERIFISVYDQGYQATADALKVIQKAAIALSVIALAVTLAVLAFFTYLFADMQRDAVEIMRCFGTRKAEVRLYLMVGTSLIALIAIMTGILIGMGYAEGLVESSYRFVSELQAVDTRYSDAFKGIIKEFTPVVTLSYPLAAAVAAGVFLISLALCLYFAERTVSGRLIAARARVRVRRSPRKSSVALSGALRHAMLSIRRGGARSLLVPVLCAVALLFVSSLQATLTSYDRAREELYENTEILGYSAQMDGKFSDRLSIRNELAKELVSMEHLSDPAYTYTFNYVYLGIPVHADGSEGQVKPVPMPMNSFELENLYNALLSEPSIVFTDAVRKAPEFYFDEFHGEFMAEWDENRFSSREWERLPCIVSNQFMDEHGIKPGDTIRVYVENYFSRDSAFVGIDMLVVGSFVRVANQNNIYCPLPLGALDPVRLSLGDLSNKHSDLSTGQYYSYAAGATDFSGEESANMLTQQQMVYIMLDNKYVSSLTFKIRDPRKLDEVKNALEQAGFSGPKMANNIRLCVVIEDGQFNETLSSITQRSKYLEILYPVLLVLVCILGLVMGFLAVNNRREDIALMRGMGTHKGRIFTTIFGEQFLLLLFGALPAAAVWYAREGATQLATPGVYAFFMCYALSGALSTLLQNAKSALSILSEKD
ncbi:MAG: FtsX-like permease family protein [Anaerolineaceae bacterium]|nr:MAG: FtsX-like permease family protein [Anaerolineaceae bacterium]